MLAALRRRKVSAVPSARGTALSAATQQWELVPQPTPTPHIEGEGCQCRVLAARGKLPGSWENCLTPRAGLQNQPALTSPAVFISLSPCLHPGCTPDPSQKRGSYNKLCTHPQGAFQVLPGHVELDYSAGCCWVPWDRAAEPEKLWGAHTWLCSAPPMRLLSPCTEDADPAWDTKPACAPQKNSCRVPFFCFLAQPVIKKRGKPNASQPPTHRAHTKYS